MYKNPFAFTSVTVAATVFLTPFFVTAANLDSILLDRTLEQFAYAPDSENFDLNSPLTIEAWIKIDSQIPSGSNFGIVTKGSEVNLDLSYAFRLRDTGDGKNELDFAYWKDTGFTERNWDVNVEPDEWVHVAAVVVPAERDIKLFLNGVVNTGAADGTVTAIHNSIGNLYIGNDAWGSGRYMDGKIDEVRVWNVARTAEEIAENMNRELEGNEPGLVGYWKMNGSFEDATANGNHLTAVNGPQFSDDVPFLDEEEGIDPVIVVPGILGSAQKNGVWHIDPILHTYDDLVATLEANGYTLGTNLFTFGYDWRASNVTTAELLKQKIDEVKLLCACEKVDLVAHSMGGLVARQYVQSGDYGDDVDQLIFLGTPHRGAPKAYLMWEGGEFVSPSITDGLTKRFLRGEARKNGFASTFAYLQNHPITAVEQLLPDYSYLYDGIILRSYPAGHPANPFLETLNAGVSSLLSSGIDLHAFVSANKDTITGIQVVSRPDKAPLWEHGYPNGFDTTGTRGLVLGEGDSTVPSSSATFISASTTILASNHTTLPEDASGDIFELLTGEEAETVVDDWNLQGMKMLLFQLFSPADILVTDPLGRHAGFDNGAEVNEIPGAFYAGPEAFVEYLTIPNPVPGTYMVRVRGTGVGTYELLSSYIAEGASDDLSRVGAASTNSVVDYSITLNEAENELQPLVTIESMLADLSFVYAQGWVSKVVEKSISAKLVAAQNARSVQARILLLELIAADIERYHGNGVNDDAYELLSEDIQALLH